MLECPECEEMGGRLQAICRGESGLPRTKENAYRAIWGFDPLPDVTNTTPRQITQSPKPPGLLTRAANFTRAAVRHFAKGGPVADQETINARLTICQSCPLFDAAKKMCTKCGCSCGGAKKFMNKLAWADSVCPHPDGPKWGAVK